MKRRYVFLIALALLALDQYSKLVFEQVSYLPIIPGVLSIRGTYNKGAAFGLFQSRSTMLAIISLLAVLGMAGFVSSKRRDPMIGIGFAFLLGGATGNLIDRGLYGEVIDFLHLDFMQFAIFNLADVFVLAGVIVLILSPLFFGKPRHEP